MNLIIAEHKAVLKQGTSFEYVSENRAFSDADDYTMSITLPLAGCPENRAIFGHIDRMDVDTRSIILEASIVDNTFTKNGVVTVVEATDAEIKIQFLEGRSVQNFLTTFDGRYINEIPELGSYPSSSVPSDPQSVLGDIKHGSPEVALPWVYDETADIQNEMVYDGEAKLSWAKFTLDTGKLSYQPYLIVITKRLCRALGYSYDFTQWEDSPHVYLLICNTLPAAWDIPQYTRALPHWTVSEFFTELEKILVCEISIDHKLKHISLAMCDQIESVANEIKLENVVDSFTSEVVYEGELCQFKGAANVKYKERSDSKWKAEQCQWLVDMIRQEGKHYREYDTYNEFCLDLWAYYGNWVICAKDAERGDAQGALFYVKDVDRYYVLRVVPTVYYAIGPTIDAVDTYAMRWLEVNQFGDLIRNKDSDNNIELSCVPARLDDTDKAHGFCLFMAPSGFSENEDLDDEGIRQPLAYSALRKGQPDSDAEYYDKIYLAHWDGHSANEDLIPPAPFVDGRFSLKRRYQNYLPGIRISPREKLKVSWISGSIPDVRAIFHINGKRYLCEKITATFTENGMSQLLKGEFYPLLDD